MKNKKIKKTHHTAAITVPTRTDYEGAPAKIVRDSGKIMANIDWATLPRPPHRFSVDCARTVIGRVQPEIQLVQTDPFSEKIARRVVVVRYEPSRFVERSEQNEEFRVALEEFLSTTKGRGTPGELSGPRTYELFEQAEIGKFDAEAEWLFRHDQTAHIIFIATYGRDLQRVIDGRSDQLPVQPIIEAIMPCRVLADLLMSWKDVAGAIRNV